MRHFIKLLIIFFLLVIQYSDSRADQADQIRAARLKLPSPVRQEWTNSTQKQFDLLPDSIYLHPQAFSNKQEDIDFFEMRVCVEYSPPVGAKFRDITGFGFEQPNEEQLVGWDSRYLYEKYSSPGICTKFKTVRMATAQKLYEVAKKFAMISDKGVLDELSKIDSDLDSRINAVMTNASLEKLRTQMEKNVKQEILNGPFVEELSKRIYDEVKSELLRDHANN